MAFRDQTNDGSIRLTGGPLVTGADIGAAARLSAGWVIGGLMNYNSVTDSGNYVMDSGAANSPWGATSYLEVRRYATTYIIQVARHVVTGLQATRMMTAGVWGGWVGDVTDLAIAAAPNCTSGSKLTRRGDTVTLYWNVAATVLLAGAAATIDIPAIHRKASTSDGNYYGTALDSATGNAVSVYLTQNGASPVRLFGTAAGAGTLGWFTYTASGNGG